MALDFPSNPTVGQTYTSGGTVWTWDGAKWVTGMAVGVGVAPIDSPVFTGNPTAPNQPAGDKDTSIANTAFVNAAVAPAFNGVGRNLIHNPLFNVAQRGTGPWSITNTYTADRWIQSLTGGTISTSIGAIIDANRVQIGDESPRFHLVANVVGGAGASDETYISQRIEDVRRLAGKTVTLSFWAVATSGTPKLGIPLIQIFGTGGSPSSPVLVAPQTVTLSTTYTRYSLTYTVPSIAGKTLGTNAGTDYLEVRFGMSCGASNNVNYGGIGQQSAVFVLWGVQLEIGNVATPLEKPDPRYDLANCQRMFCLVPVFSLFSASQPSQYLSATGTCPVTMRAVPTLTPAAIIAADQNLNTFTVDLPTVGGFRAYAISNNPGATSFSRLISCSADL